MKRLIEVALPLREISEESSREKSIRHGHISTLHIWWARRPLAACRAIIFASLIPDPDDPNCPKQFVDLVADLLGRNEFKPKNIDDVPVEDSPRNRCIEFLKHLVTWENSSNDDYIAPARKLLGAAHKILHPASNEAMPTCLDPFGGGGAIPLEFLRLGCNSHSLDLNPVAHLIQRCTLVYAEKFGTPNSRELPPYITGLIQHRRDERRARGETDLFDDSNTNLQRMPEGHTHPDIEITEEDYKKNPLAADVEYWGHWVMENARHRIGHYYPIGPDGSEPVAYLWMRTVTCTNPNCSATIPCCRQTWLCNKSDRKVALRIDLDEENKRCSFHVEDGKKLSFDPSKGTMQRGQVSCPFCQSVLNSKYLQAEGNAGRIGQQLAAVISVRDGVSGKSYRVADRADLEAYAAAESALQEILRRDPDILPTEQLQAWSGVFNAPLFGLTTWRSLFNSRQLLALATLIECVREVTAQLKEHTDPEYESAVGTFLGLAVSRFTDFNSTLCTWNYTGGRGVGHTFTRQALAMVWDYPESAAFNPQGANWQACVNAAVKTIRRIDIREVGNPLRGTASRLAMGDETLDAIITDPPYYDAVPYSDLSDYFYVWLKRSVGHLHPELFSTPLTPKRDEIVSHLGSNYPGERKDEEFYEAGMESAFREAHRTLVGDGIVAVMFAHKTTTAWETLIGSLVRAGLYTSASWPFHTERAARMRAQGSAALASSVTLVCRKRPADAGEGLWDDVRNEVKDVCKERLEFFWAQNIRGADFFISAIGPSLSVYGRYARVIRLTGDEVKVGEFLDEVRGLVTNFALTKILRTTQTSSIDSESRFYVVWKWSYGDAKVPADESFKLAQALGMDTEEMWDRTGVLSKTGESVACLSTDKRMKVKDLGELASDGTPASLIDVLHRLCAFREQNDSTGMAEFLGRSGQARNSSLWLVAQAVSEILPDGEKEKQLLQGLLNQKEGLEEATREGRLF